ncbi:Uncharacterised protein [Klebsiella pneumoniae]|nr:Uncharacterised protein [Klebsiella pneumoniae]
MPGWPVRHKRIPALGAPALSDAAAFQDDVRHAHLRQMFTHSNTGLTRADNHSINLFD